MTNRASWPPARYDHGVESVADRFRDEDRRAVAAMSAGERLRLALALGRRDLDTFASRTFHRSPAKKPPDGSTASAKSVVAPRAAVEQPGWVSLLAPRCRPPPPAGLGIRRDRGGGACRAWHRPVDAGSRPIGPRPPVSRPRLLGPGAHRWGRGDRTPRGRSRSPGRCRPPPGRRPNRARRGGRKGALAVGGDRSRLACARRRRRGAGRSRRRADQQYVLVLCMYFVQVGLLPALLGGTAFMFAGHNVLLLTFPHVGALVVIPGGFLLRSAPRDQKHVAGARYGWGLAWARAHDGWPARSPDIPSRSTSDARRRVRARAPVGTSRETRAGRPRFRGARAARLPAAGVCMATSSCCPSSSPCQHSRLLRGAAAQTPLHPHFWPLELFPNLLGNPSLPTTS